MTDPRSAIHGGTRSGKTTTELIADQMFHSGSAVRRLSDAKKELHICGSLQFNSDEEIKAECDRIATEYIEEVIAVIKDMQRKLMERDTLTQPAEPATIPEPSK